MNLDELEKLYNERDNDPKAYSIGRWWGEITRAFPALLARIRSLKHDHKLMRETLTMYADEKNWDQFSHELWVPLVHGDEPARTALSSLLVDSVTVTHEEE